MKNLLKSCLEFLNENDVPNCTELKHQIETKLELYRDSEILGYVSKEDLESIGFNTDNLVNDDISDIASKMLDAYCDNGYWIDLEIIAENKDIPKRTGVIGTFKIDGDNLHVYTEKQELFLKISDFKTKYNLDYEDIKYEINDLSDISIDNIDNLSKEIYNEIKKL